MKVNIVLFYGEARGRDGRNGRRRRIIKRGWRCMPTKNREAEILLWSVGLRQEREEKRGEERIGEERRERSGGKK